LQRVRAALPTSSIGRSWSVLGLFGRPDLYQTCIGIAPTKGAPRMPAAEMSVVSGEMTGKFG
jgi:hypothetical protein